MKTDFLSHRRSSKILGSGPEAFFLVAILVGSLEVGFPSPALAKKKPPVTYSIVIPPKPDFSAFDWLLGDWSGSTAKGDPAGAVKLSVAYDLDKRVVIFRGNFSLPATPSVPATDESWLGVLTSAEPRNGFALEVFSSTGFITRYRLSVEGPEIRFNPEGGRRPPPGWLFRTVIARTGPEEFTETVQAAPPGKPFFVYYTAKLSHAGPPGQKGQDSASPASKVN